MGFENKYYFSKIPNLVFYRNTANNQSLLELVDYDHKVVSIVDYLYSNTGIGNGLCKFTLEDMVMSCGYKPNPNKGKINDVFKSLLCKLKDLDIIYFEFDINTLKPKDHVKCKIDIDVSTDFTTISLESKEKIYSVEGAEKSQLFTYYGYLNARMYKRSKEDGRVEINGGRYEACFLSYRLMSEDLQISETALMRYNDILSDLDLIRYKNFGVYYYENQRFITTKNSPNFYTLFDGDEKAAEINLKGEFKRFCNLPENSSKIFDKEHKMNNRSIGGKKGSLIVKQNKGTITPDEIKELESLEEQLSSDFDDKKFARDTFEQMKSNDEQITLSDYFGEDNRKYCDKFEEIESSLGLTVNQELLVSFEFYKKIMSNYSKKDHDKFVEKVKFEIENNNGDWGESNPILTETQLKAKEIGLNDESHDEMFS